MAIGLAVIVVGLRGPAGGLARPAVGAAGFAIAALGAATLVTPIFHERYLGLFAPWVTLAIAGGLAALGRWAAPVTLPIGAAAIVAGWTWVSGAVPNDDLRGLAADLRASVRPGDAVVLSPAWVWYGLDYYDVDVRPLEWRGLIDTTDGAAADPPPVLGVGFLGRSPRRPTEIYPVSDWQAVEAGLARLAQGAERLWLVRLGDSISDPAGRLIAELDRRFPGAAVRRYPGATAGELRRYQLRPTVDLLADPGARRFEAAVPGFGRLLGWRWRSGPVGVARSRSLQVSGR